MQRLFPYLALLALGALISFLALESPERGLLWAFSGPAATLSGWLFCWQSERKASATALSQQSLESEVSERITAERRLHLFRSVVDSSAEMIYVLKPVEGRIVYANESINRETGFSLSEVINRSFSSLVAELPATASSAQWKQWLLAADETKLEPQEGLHRRKDGTTFPVAMRASLIEHDEQAFVVALIEDITERRQREQELEAARDELTQLSRQDGLLGIANRRRFDESFELEWNRAARQGAFISLVLADIDHFKPYNDRYGHPAGDQCLKEVAQVFTRSIFRPADLVARYGGEELVVLLPETEALGAKLVAEDLRTGVEALAIEHKDSTTAKTVTISLGVGTIRPAPTVHPAEFLEAVDQALYTAKQSGRNRVEQLPIAQGPRTRRRRGRKRAPSRQQLT